MENVVLLRMAQLATGNIINHSERKQIYKHNKKGGQILQYKEGKTATLRSRHQLLSKLFVLFKHHDRRLFLP